MSNAYHRISIHRWMLQDEVRNEAYRQALAKVVQPGQVVLDMGAGTGLLSVFATQAGASKVFAVERTSIAAVARRLVHQNGLADRIEVMETDLEDARLPEKVDVITSEWMGGLGNDENMLAPLVMARDRWLKPGGVVVPARVTAYLAPAWIEGFEVAQERLRARPHGVDLSVVATMTVNELHTTHARVTPEDLFAAPQALWSHDALTCSLEEADRPVESQLTFTSVRAGRVLGLVAWFEADMCPGLTLTNAVGAPETHWGRIFFALDRGVDVVAGTPIRVAVGCFPSVPGTSEFRWEVTIGDGPTERHDSTRPFGIDEA